MATEPQLAAIYARFRGSAWFVLFLCVFLAGWFAVNLLPELPHFDRPGYGVLNVILSSEASLSVALLIMATEKQDRVQRQQLAYMLHIMEALRAQFMGSLAGDFGGDAGGTARKANQSDEETKPKMG